MDTGEEKEGNEKSFLKSIQYVIENVRTNLNDSPKSGLIQNKACEVVNRFFYSNLFNIYKNNLSNISEHFNISVGIQEEILNKFSILFENAYKNLTDSGPDDDEIDEYFIIDISRGISQETYENFKKDLEKIDSNAYQGLLAMEESLDLDNCINILDKFKEEIEDLGRDVKIGFDIDDDSFSMGIDWDD